MAKAQENGSGSSSDSKSRTLSEMKHRLQTKTVLIRAGNVEMTDELFIVVVNSIECPGKHDLGVSLRVPLKSRLKRILKLFLN